MFLWILLAMAKTYTSFGGENCVRKPKNKMLLIRLQHFFFLFEKQNEPPTSNARVFAWLNIWFYDVFCNNLLEINQAFTKVLKTEWQNNAPPSLFPSVAKENTAEMRGSPSSSSTMRLSSITGAWVGDPVILAPVSLCLLWPFTGILPLFVAMVTLSRG